MCKRRLLARHAGPLHLGLEDVFEPEVPQKENKTDSDLVQFAGEDGNATVNKHSDEEKINANDDMAESIEQKDNACGKPPYNDLLPPGIAVRKDHGRFKKQ